MGGKDRDRQTDRPTDRQTETYRDRQTETDMTNRQKNRQSHSRKGRHIERLTDRQGHSNCVCVGGGGRGPLTINL